MHPPAPWRLHGELTIVPARVRVADARRAPIPPGVELISAGGSTAGGALLARYTGGTLAYHELIVFSGIGRLGPKPGVVVSHIYVDDEQSMAGGRAIWGLPKELAEFTYSRSRVEVRQRGGLLLAATIRRRPRGLLLPLLAPTLGTGVHAVGRMLIKASPARATLEVPDSSPFAALGLAGTRAALAADDVRLLMPA
jgi:Acetoacetate decarboxylase (ADC)